MLRRFSILVLATLFVGSPLPGSAQIEAGSLAAWSDLSTWSRRDEATGLTETGLGLVAMGQEGAMRLAFAVRVATRARSATSEVIVRATAGPRINPNTLRTPTLGFLLDADSGDKATIDVTPRLAVNDPAPGAWVESGVATMPREDFLRLARAKTIAPRIFGIAVELREDQIDAIRAFRDRVFPPTK